LQGLSGVKSEVIDQGALRAVLKSAVGSDVHVTRVAEDEMVSKEPESRGGRAPRAREVAGADTPEGVMDAVDVMEEALDTDFSEAELRDFLAADCLETRADPAFKETLRKKLWTLVGNRYGRGPSSAE
jgi:hypothetical protein